MKTKGSSKSKSKSSKKLGRRKSASQKAVIDKKMNSFFMAVIVRVPIIALKLPSRYSERLDALMLIYKGIFNNVNGWFTVQPTQPTLIILKQKIDAFAKANKDVLMRKMDATNIRRQAWREAKIAADGIKAYVQMLCWADPDHAAEIAAEAYMKLVYIEGGKKKVFSAKSEKTGEVELTAVFLDKRQATEWDISFDINDPDAWFKMRIPATLAAETTVTGLPSNIYAYFRFRTILKDGPTPWSEVIRIIVK